jgi:hypothetical protein
VDLGQVAVSMVPNNRDKVTLRRVRVSAIMDAVRNGRWAKQVRHVRHMKSLGMDNATVNQAKGQLPAILPSGVFTHASRAGFAGQHSGVICADLDHVDPLDVQDACEDLPWVGGWFVSPSGDGVKVLCLTDAATEAEHSQAWGTVRAALASVGLEMDGQTKDINRLCYVSHDPGAVLRPCDSLPIDRSLPATPVIEDLSGLQCEFQPALHPALDALAQLGQAIEGRNGSMLTWKACRIGHEYGIDLADWFRCLLRWNQDNQPPWDHQALQAKCRSAYSTSLHPFGYMAMFQGII